MRRIIKIILQRINSDLKRKLELNQWVATKQAIDWFKRIDNKEKIKFIVFDIESFYPSINEELLRKALDMAGQYTYVCDKAKEIIMHARKSIL